MSKIQYGKTKHACYQYCPSCGSEKLFSKCNDIWDKNEPVFLICANCGREYKVLEKENGIKTTGRVYQTEMSYKYWIPQMVYYDNIETLI